ncbi:MAG: hypothetical protein ING40_00810 [Burkholderiales bacterium]|jgi:hypothetical protein|nr:hypothetical protein [Burkholderiales bacterium]
MSGAVQAIQNKITKKQAEVDALKLALSVLGAAGAVLARGQGKGTRRPRSAAEKKAMSKAVRAAWRRRKAAASKASAKVADPKKGSRKKSSSKKTPEATPPAS